jgi:hypothetical protein
MAMAGGHRVAEENRRGTARIFQDDGGQDMQHYQYAISCVSSHAEAITTMVDRASEITYRTFTRWCAWAAFARALGYTVGAGPGLHLRDDGHVRYFSSRYRGQRCYYCTHSAIEHLFLST